jgi:hypothetical protein
MPPLSAGRFKNGVDCIFSGMKIKNYIVMIKSPQAISCVSWLKITDVSGTISVPQTLKTLTHLIAQEDFINFSSHESFRSCIVMVC